MSIADLRLRFCLVFHLCQTTIVYLTEPLLIVNEAISSLLAVTNNATMNIFFTHSCVFVQVYPRSEMSRSNVTFFNDCQILSSNKGYTNSHSHQLFKRVSCFPMPLPALGITSILNLWQSNRWKVTSSYYFNVNFFNYEWQMFIGHWWSMNEKCLFLSSFCLFLTDL